MFFVLFGCGSKDSLNETEICKNALDNVNKEGMSIVDCLMHNKSTEYCNQNVRRLHK